MRGGRERKDQGVVPPPPSSLVTDARRTRFCPRGRVNPPPETDWDLGSGRDPPPKKPTLPSGETDEFRRDTSPI